MNDALAVSARRHAGGYQHPAPSTTIVARHCGRTATLDLRQSYRLCRRITTAHGRTFAFAARLLPAAQRRHVHALYAFARYADDLVDHLDLDWSPARRRLAFEAWSCAFLGSLESGRTDDPVLVAVVESVERLGIDHADLRAFLRSMAMDLDTTRYQTYADLYEYMYGSAAVIGSMMLPVLGAPRAQARGPAMDLGLAFQLTNFLRDVAEDWSRGRIYLPLEDLDRFGVAEWDFRAGYVSPAFRRLLAFEIVRARRLYQQAETGWGMLPPASRACVRVAHRLYEGILRRIEDCDYQIFRSRASVRMPRKLLVAAREVAVPSRPTMAVETAECHHGGRGGSEAKATRKPGRPTVTEQTAGVRPQARVVVRTKASSVAALLQPPTR